MAERERKKDSAVSGTGARRDAVDEHAGTRPPETRTGKTTEDVASRDPHAPGVDATRFEEKGANARGRGMPTPPDAPRHLGNKAYQGEVGRGEELRRESAEGERKARRSSHGRVSPADVENATEPSGKDVNQ